MAQLPPKIPNIVAQDHHHDHNPHQWLEFDHDSLPPQQEGHHNPSWVDEFMEFSEAKRGVHRRSVSDSTVAFMEGGVLGSTMSFRALETDGGSKGGQNHDHEQFEKLDDEQLMSMFSSNEPGVCSNPTSTSDHNSTNEDQRRTARPGGGGSREERERAEEVESSSKGDNKKEGQEGSGGTKGGVAAADVAEACDNAGGGDQQPAVFDPKRVKRILANRQSAQRSRVRKLQYISELERIVTALQSEVSVLSPQVAFLDHQRMILSADNSALKAKIVALAQDKIFKDAHQEALKREIERLRQVYYQQSLKKTTDVTITPPSLSPLPSPIIQFPQPDIKDNETEQLIS